MVKRYSLEELRRLREQHLSEQIERVAAQVQRVADAESSARDAAEARVSAQERLRIARSTEASRLEQGRATVQDLARQAAWESQVAHELELARQGERQAAARLLAERQLEVRLRAELADKEAELKAVERHKQAWSNANARAEELEVEEQALEAWSARPRGRA